MRFYIDMVQSKMQYYFKTDCFKGRKIRGMKFKNIYSIHFCSVLEDVN